LAVASFALGAITITPQLIIPFATSLSEPEKRGAVVGKLMAGLLTGILLSRTLGGFVGTHFGWRAVYWFSAAMNLVLLAIMFVRLPACPPSSGLSYRELLKSLWQIASKERIVQTSSFFGAMTFASFNVFWTTLSFYASAAPYNYSAEIIGLFGVIGATGALAAPFAGRLADMHGPMFGIGISLCLVVLSFVELFFCASNLLGLIIGIIILDLAAHSSQVSNMARIYSLPASMSSRVNTIYMTSYFIGASLGALLGTLAWSRYGWLGACTAGGAFAALGLLLFIPVVLDNRYHAQSKITHGDR
jgi:predicted MFS family arabinose efflux permease